MEIRASDSDFGLMIAAKRTVSAAVYKRLVRWRNDNGPLKTVFELDKIISMIKQDIHIYEDLLGPETEPCYEPEKRTRAGRPPYNAGRQAALCRGDERSRKLHNSGRNREQRGEFRGGADKRTMRVD